MAVGAFGLSSHAPLTLFTQDDVASLRFSDHDWPQVPRSRGLDASGPRIVFEHPEVHDVDGGPTIEMTTPGALLVRFEPGQAPIDMHSLQVTAKKGFFSKSLTDMLRPYVHDTVVEVGKLEVPTGKFMIEIAITDQHGDQTVGKYRLDVTEGHGAS
jgi:hypothetical protein